MLPGVIFVEDISAVFEVLEEHYNTTETEREKAFDTVYNSIETILSILTTSIPNKQNCLDRMYNNHLVKNQEIQFFRHLYEIDFIKSMTATSYLDSLYEVLHEGGRPHWKRFFKNVEGHGESEILFNLSSGELVCLNGDIMSWGKFSILPNIGAVGLLGEDYGHMPCWWDRSLSHVENYCGLSL